MRRSFAADRRGGNRRDVISRPVLGSLCAFTAAAIWGGMYVVSKFVLGYLPPLTLVVLRLAIATLVLGGVSALLRRGRLPRRELPRVALLGLVGYTVSLSAQFVGTRLSTAHDGALITSATPAFIAFFAWTLLGEQVTVRRWLAIVVATAGVLIVSFDPTAGDSASAPLLGNLFLVLAALTWAAYSVLGKDVTGRCGALRVTAYAVAFGTLFTAPLVPFELGALAVPVAWSSAPFLAWAGVLYLGLVATAGAFYLWNKGFELLDASVASTFFFAQPLVGSFLGWSLLGERLSATVFLGSSLIAIGVGLAAWGGRRDVNRGGLTGSSPG